MDPNIELGISIAESHRRGESKKHDPLSDSLKVQSFDVKTFYGIPKNADIGIIIKAIVDSAGMFKPTFEYSKSMRNYSIRPRSVIKRTQDLVSLFETQKDEAIKMLSNLKEPLVMTQELMNIIQKTRSHFSTPIARLLDDNFKTFFRRYIQPPYLNEMYYPQEFLFIKKEEDDYRADPHVHDSHYGLMKVDSTYLNKIGYDDELTPHINLYPSIKQMYDSKRLEKLIKVFVDAVAENFPTIPLNQLVIAGGSIASLFHDRFNPGSQDLDVFVIGDIDKEALSQDMKNKKIIFNNNIIGLQKFMDFVDAGVAGVQYVSLKIQLIKRRYNNLSEILHGFDVDSSCIGVECHTKNIYVTKRFDYAYRNGYNTVDLDRLSPSYESRLWKYSRRGWGVFIPGVSNVSNFDMRDERYKKWTQLNSQIDNLLKQKIVSKRTIWESSSGLTRLAIMNKYKHKGSIKYTSDYYRGAIHEKIDDLNEHIFNEWLIQNPGTQHTASFHPLPNDKSWYDSSVQSIEELIDVTRDVLEMTNFDHRFIKMYNLRKLPDGTYISNLFKHSVDQPSEPTEYYYLVNAIVEDDLAPLNRLMSMSVYDSTKKLFVGILTGVHSGEISPKIVHTGKLIPSIVSPHIGTVLSEDAMINEQTQIMKEMAAEGRFEYSMDD